MQRLIRTTLLSVSVLAWSSAVTAQSNPQELTQMTRAAMDAYNNLDIESAKKQLENAVAGAERSGVGGAALARAYASLGVVWVGGYGDNGRGMDFFVKALRLDPGVQLDPIVSTPDIQQVFSLAQRKAGAGGGSSPSPQPLPAVTDSAGPAEGNLDHVPALEQLTQTAVPVYVEVPDGLDVEKVRIFYRSLGMREPKSADLERIGEGWGYLIPCTDVFEPNVEYFVMALDDDDEQVGNAGSPQNPVSVPVVAERSQPAPSLPGQIPPAQCTGGAECPPGMPGCAGGGGLGDTCRADSDCGEGLACDDNFCAVGSGGSKKKDSGDAPRFFFNVGASIGLAYVGQGMKADSAPPLALLEQNGGAAKDEANAQRQCDLNGSCSGPDGIAETGDDDVASPDGFVESEYETRIATAGDAAVRDAQANGWDCNPRVNPGLGGNIDYSDPSQTDAQISLEDCAVAVSTPGFVPTLAIRATAGFFVTDRLSLAATVRYQLGAGKGTLAGILVGGRIGYQVTEPSATGLYASVFAGGSFGQIQPQPESQTDVEGPYVIGGLGGVQAGAMLGYRFTRNIGIGITPEVHFLLPTFLFNLDISPVLQVAF